MQYYGRRGRVPWIVDHATRGCSFEAKDEGRRGVGSSPRPKGGQIILGFANYYLRFVQGYAELESPLTYLTKKDVPWVWGPPQRQAFQRLKQALCNVPLLQYPDPSKPYVVVTDALGLAVGGVF